MAALSSWTGSFYIRLGGMRVPVGEPGAPGEGMLSCLNLGKSHRKDASEPGIAALPSLPRQLCLDQSLLPHRKSISFPSSALGHCARELKLQRTR